MLTMRRVLALVILVAILVLAGVLWRHLRDQPLSDIVDSLPQSVDLALDRLHYTQTEAGKKRWTLTSERAEYLRDSALVRLAPVDLAVFDAGVFGDLTLQAQRGEFREDIARVDVWDDVVLTAATGERLVTDALRYDDNNRQLSSTAPIRITSPRMTLTGIGLLIDLEKNTLLVQKDVTMLLLPNAKEETGEK
ncbi:MAG: LPS export ABC transporter periplasmic protein LptC [Pelovirga sp.]